MEQYTKIVLWTLLIAFSLSCIMAVSFLFHYGETFMACVIALALGVSIWTAVHHVREAIKNEEKQEDEKLKNILNSIFLAKEIFPDGWPTELVGIINGNDRGKKENLLGFGIHGLNLSQADLEEKIVLSHEMFAGVLDDWEIQYLRARLNQRFVIDCKNTLLWILRT